MSRLDGAQISIVGLAASGHAAARLALNRGGLVYVSDLRTDAATAARGDELRALGAQVELGGHSVERIAASEAVVVSPGIPPDAPVLVALRAAGVRWISEPEFAFRFYSGSLIAVTGTNGKTTTAALTAHVLERAGVDVALGGNVGLGLAPPASALALREPAPAWYVVELSSFQLADIEYFRPDVGVVTNLAPDHLDRYASVEDYYGDKARLFENADADSVWVLNGDDPAVDRLAGDARGRRRYFSATTCDGADACVEDGTLSIATEGGDRVAMLACEALPLVGAHNVENALAAALAAHAAGVDAKAIGRGLVSAPPLPHRMESVAEGGGVRWVNDSKATNVTAAASAIRSVEARLVVLLGGKDKGEDFAPLVEAMRGRVRVAVLVGEAAGRLELVLGSDVPTVRAGGSFEEAVALAAGLAEPGDTVLLAPACSSFDMFESYEARGERFRELAKEAALAASDGGAH